MGKEKIQLDPDALRLACIDEAVEKGFEPDDQWADWLIAGVEIVSKGGVVTPKWLKEFDKSNSYI